MALANMVRPRRSSGGRVRCAPPRPAGAAWRPAMLAAEPAEVGRLMAGTRVLTSMWHHTDRPDPPAYPLRAAVNTADGRGGAQARPRRRAARGQRAAPIARR